MQSVWAFTPLEADFIRWSFHFVFSKDLHRSPVGTLSCSLVISSAKLAKLLVCTIGNRIPGHHKGATGRIELAANCIKFYALANLGKTSLLSRWIKSDLLTSDHSAFNAMSVI